MANWINGGTYSNLHDNTNGGAINKGIAGINGYATFTSCYATDGGAIWFDKGSVTLTTGTEFTGNSATGNGGAVFVGNTSLEDAVLNIAGVQFISNTATNGGAIYFNVGKGQSGNYFNSITDCTFNGNSATANGGAIYNNNHTVKISGTTFATASDTIYNKDTLTFSGTNNLAASVTTASGASTTSADNSIFNFNNTAAITVQCAFGNNNTLGFNNTASTTIEGNIGDHSTLNFNGVAATVTGNIGTGATLNFANSGTVAINGTLQSGANISFTGTGSVDCSGLTINGNPAGISIGNGTTIGAQRTVATGLTGVTDALSVSYLGSTAAIADFSGLSLSNGTLTATLTAYDCMKSTLADTATINMSTANYSESFTNVTLAADKAITGASTANLSGKIYADGKALSIDGINYQGIIYGANAIEANKTFDDVSLSFGKTSEVTIGDGSTNTRIYGGADVEGGVATLGNVSLDFGTGATLGNGVSIYGLGYITGAATAINATSVTLNFDGNAECTSTGVSNIYAGAYVGSSGSGETITVSGAVSTTISNGHFYLAGNGSRLNSNATSSQGASSLTISGGTYDAFVYAGGFTTGGTVTVASTALTITGGTFNNFVFGGCASNDSDNGNKTTVTGNVNVTIGATGDNTIKFNKSVFAGNLGAGAVGGNVTVTLKGDGDKIVWYAGAGLFGSNQNTTTGTVTGTQTLVFDGFSNKLGAFLHNTFSVVTMTSSDVTFSNAALLADVNTWNMGADCSLTWTNHKIPVRYETEKIVDLSEDTLNLSGYEALDAGDSTVLFDFGSYALDTWFTSVKFGDMAATLDAEAKSATYGDYTLSYTSENNKSQIVLSRAANA